MPLYAADAHQNFHMRIDAHWSAYAHHPHEPHGSASACPSLIYIPFIYTWYLSFVFTMYNCTIVFHQWKSIGPWRWRCFQHHEGYFHKSEFEKRKEFNFQNWIPPGLLWRHQGHNSVDALPQQGDSSIYVFFN